MSTRSRKPREARLTAGQREWLEHLRAAARSGETIKAYAARRDLSVQSMYQAGKRLIGLGLIEPRVRRKQDSARRFVKVERAGGPRETDAAWRIRLASGVVFESHAALAHAELVSLLVALGTPR